MKIILTIKDYRPSFLYTDYNLFGILVTGVFFLQLSTWGTSPSVRLNTSASCALHTSRRSCSGARRSWPRSRPRSSTKSRSSETSRSTICRMATSRAGDVTVTNTAGDGGLRRPNRDNSDVSRGGGNEGGFRQRKNRNIFNYCRVY